MPIITKIQKQVKRAEKYSIFVDEKYSFSLFDHQLAKLHLRVGQQITKKRLDELKNESSASKAFDKALNKLSYRQHSVFEIQDYLKSREFSQEIIDSTITKLLERKYLDDTEFAAAWIKSRKRKSKSDREISSELSRDKVFATLEDSGLKAEILKSTKIAHVENITYYLVELDGFYLENSLNNLINSEIKPHLNILGHYAKPITIRI